MSVVKQSLVVPHSAMVAMLHHYGKSGFVGVRFSEFQEDQGLAVEVGKGIQVLKQMGWATSTSPLVLDAVFETTIRSLLFRQLALLVVLMERGSTYSLSFNRNVEEYEEYIEHYVNKEGSHVLTRHTGYQEVISRVADLIPLEPVIREERPTIALETGFVSELVELPRNDSSLQKVAQMLSSYTKDEELVSRLSRALLSPVFTASVALIELEGDEASQASSFTVFADENSAWGIWPKSLEPPMVWVMPSDVNDVKSCLTDWFQQRVS
ncbi:MAG: hypothetical protein KIS88_06065 [Anaerolineales bacterium]|nr:hypothetical protein [Anaerolineales bacterium]